MGDITLKFDSIEQLQAVAGFVESIFNVYNKSSLGAIKSLNNKLASIDSETMLNVDLSEDESECLDNMCSILNCISADDIIAGCDVSSKIARLVITKSDVPRFLAMLKENNVPAEYCVGLFSCWCSCEGTAALAEKCMNIQTKCGIDITAVWEWVCTHDPCQSTDWTKEVERFKKEIVTADFKSDNKPVLDQNLCFGYKGYNFELSSCNNITHRNQIVDITVENIKERFPNGIFSDRYVCWMWGHKDCAGHTKEEVDNPEFFASNIYLVPDAWSWGADDDLKPGAEVNPLILAAINNFLETFKE